MNVVHTLAMCRLTPMSQSLPSQSVHLYYYYNAFVSHASQPSHKCSLCPVNVLFFFFLFKPVIFALHYITLHYITHALCENFVELRE